MKLVPNNRVSFSGVVPLGTLYLSLHNLEFYLSVLHEEL